MEIKQQILKRWNTSLWCLMFLESVLTTVSILRFPSEEGSAYLFGYSRIILLAAVITAFISVLLLIATIASITRPQWWQSFTEKIHRFFTVPSQTFFIFAFGFVILLALLTLQLLTASAASNEAVILISLFKRFGMHYFCIELVILELIILLKINLPDIFSSMFTPLRLALLFSIFSLVYLIGIKLYAHWMWLTQFREMENYIFLPALMFLIWAWMQQKFHTRNWYPRFTNFMLSVAIAIVTYTIYRQTSQWVNWYNTPSKVYWHELADAFLNGRLNLLNPTTTHDLTLFQGKWYVPNPPLPALILMPFVAIAGVENINMVLFSIVCGSLTTVLMFWLLEAASRQKIIPTSRHGNLWLTAVFAFGTCFWWLSVMGRMWFLSQIFTVMFTALAAWFAVRRKSPWLVGIALGIAILARPNVFTIWPFLLGITLFFEQRDTQNIQWKNIIVWAIKSAIPVILAVIGLLYYNQIRFNNFFDFGYVSINSAEWLMDSVQTYGMFHPHFIASNFSMMFLNHPNLILQNGCLAYKASRDGYSLLIMTPAILYVLRRIQKNWWMLGAWISILLTITLLLFYHNNGAWQLGYRYLMDFIVPVLLVMAVGVGNKVSRVFKTLAIISILSSMAGILWWFEMWFC